MENSQTLNGHVVSSSYEKYNLVVGICRLGWVEPVQSRQKIWFPTGGICPGYPGHGKLPSVTPNLTQGDIAVPVSHIGTDEDALDAFVTDQKALWMTGIVHYRIEEDEYEGVVEPVFSDAQIANITDALQQIETGVPCIEFRYCDFLLLPMNVKWDDAFRLVG